MNKGINKGNIVRKRRQTNCSYLDFHGGIEGRSQSGDYVTMWLLAVSKSTCRHNEVCLCSKTEQH